MPPSDRRRNSRLRNLIYWEPMSNRGSAPSPSLQEDKKLSAGPLKNIYQESPFAKNMMQPQRHAADFHAALKDTPPSMATRTEG